LSIILKKSPNVARELKTVQDHLREHLKDQPAVTVSVKELGRAQIDSLFQRRGSFIEVRSDVFCPASIELSEKGPNWVAYILTVPGDWVRQIFVDHGEALFSANYRGFLGLNKRSTINTGIRNTAELAPRDFWVFNNGITLLTHKVEEQKGGLRLTGISIINWSPNHRIDWIS